MDELELAWGQLMDKNNSGTWCWLPFHMWEHFRRLEAGLWSCGWLYEEKKPWIERCVAWLQLWLFLIKFHGKCWLLSVPLVITCSKRNACECVQPHCSMLLTEAAFSREGSSKTRNILGIICWLAWACLWDFKTVCGCFSDSIEPRQIMNKWCWGAVVKIDVESLNLWKLQVQTSHDDAVFSLDVCALLRNEFRTRIQALPVVSNPPGGPAKKVRQ